MASIERRRASGDGSVVPPAGVPRVPRGLDWRRGLVVSSGPPTGRRRPGDNRAEIAQLVEHATENRGVASSTLALGTITRVGIERKWLSW